MPSKTLNEQKKHEEKEAFREMRREGQKSAATTVKERASMCKGKNGNSQPDGLFTVTSVK